MKTTEKDIPEFTDLFDFYQHIHATPPLNKDFDIRIINPEVLKSYDFVARPFRHKFYCVALYMEGDVTLNVGFWKTKLERPAVYFKTPHQLLSWTKPERWLKEYFIVFTEQFALRHKPIADLIFELPFFKFEKTIPFEVSPADTSALTEIFQKIHVEYASANEDRFEMIYFYTLILLINVRRLYYHYVETDGRLSQEVKRLNNGLIDKFEKLIKNTISSDDSDSKKHSVKHYASLLSTHPNHLNAVVKTKTNKTALSLIHSHIMAEAKSLLGQTSLPIKQIASKLGFHEVSHFNNFFKKQMGFTAAQFRKKMA